MACREVLCDFEGRRRPVLFPTSTDINEENKNLFSSVKSTFSDVLSRKEDEYYLQVDSEKHGLIDVIGSSTRVAENTTVFLRYWSHPEYEVYMK